MNWTKSELWVLPLCIGIIAVITIGLYFLLRNKSHLIKKIPLMIIAGALIILEIVKNVVAIKNGSWSEYTLPLHFCSLFLFFFAMASFGTGKVEKWGFALSFTSCLWFIVLFYIAPSTVIGGSADNVFMNFGNFHTFFYHHCIILFFTIMTSLKMYKPDLKHIWTVLIAYSTYFAVAVPCANLFDANYCNLLFSNIGFMQALLDSAGYPIYLITMFIVGNSVGCVFLIIGYYVCKLFTNKKKNNNKN